ncbi:MAG: AMP-binding protein, partial [Planctomycetota bacterium]
APIMADPQRNVAALVLQHAREHPDRLAIVVPVPRGANSLTFGQLAARMEQLADAMAAAGLRRGDRVALLFPLSTDFYALALALMARGLVVVLIDGALDRRRMVRALAAARPRAVVSVRAVLRLWPLLPVLWRCKLISVDGAAFGPPRAPASPATRAACASVRPAWTSSCASATRRPSLTSCISPRTN